MKILVMWEHPSEIEEATLLAHKLAREERAEQVGAPQHKMSFGGQVVRTIQGEFLPKQCRIHTRACDYREMVSTPSALATDLILGEWNHA